MFDSMRVTTFKFDQKFVAFELADFLKVRAPRVCFGLCLCVSVCLSVRVSTGVVPSVTG
jgi:hypothetical protein